MQIYFAFSCNSTRISLKMQVFYALERFQFPDFIVVRWENLSLAVVRALQRSRGTGPRATVTGHLLHRTAAFTVGRGPVPRHAADYRKLAGDRPPRYDKKTPLIVGLGPSHATRACERVSLAIVRALRRSRGTGPRATKKNASPSS